MSDTHYIHNAWPSDGETHNVAAARAHLESTVVELESAFEPLEIKADRLGQFCDVVQTAALAVVAVCLLRRR